MASGLCAALTGRTHGCTDQPANVKKTLANSEPSTHGTSRPSIDVGSTAASLIGRQGQALSGHPPLRCQCRSRALASLRTRHQGPCMALSLSRNLPGPRIFFLRRFLDLISKSVSSSRPAHRWSMRAEAVKIGRRTNLAACFALARPYLDGFEHDGTLNAVAMTIRGEPAFGTRFNRATTLYPVGPR